MTEEHPTYPSTVYGASKLAGECYTRAFYDTYGYATVVVRPFNAYGPRSHHEGDSGEVIPKFLLRTLAGQPMIVFGDGNQTRDFTYVTDTARGIAAAGLSDSAIGATINVGYGREIAVNQLANEVASVVGQAPRIEHIEPRPGDVLRLYSRSDRARQMLGYEPAVGLREGLALLRDWYKEQSRKPEELLREERVRNWTL
jgi:UDP-glucose 4-epimerase